MTATTAPTTTDARGDAPEARPFTTRIAAILRLQTANVANVLVWPLGVLAFVLLLNVAISIVIEQSVRSAADNGGEADITITVNGGVAFLYIYMLIIAVQAVNTSFSVALGWGATRRDFALGTLAFFGLMSLSYGLLIAVMAVLEQATNGWGRGLRFFGDPSLGLTEFGPAFLFSFLLLLLFMSIGGATAAVYVRWRATGMYVFWAAFAVLLVGVAALIGYTDNWSAVGRFFADAGVLGTALWTLVLTAASTLALYLVLRWATPRD
ncbi:MAG: ABC transporter permease [Microcella sp.]